MSSFLAEIYLCICIFSVYLEKEASYSLLHISRRIIKIHTL